jgi:hypothetical protein
MVPKNMSDLIGKGIAVDCSTCRALPPNYTITFGPLCNHAMQRMGYAHR